MLVARYCYYDAAAAVEDVVDYLLLLDSCDAGAGFPLKGLHRTFTGARCACILMKRAGDVECGEYVKK